MEKQRSLWRCLPAKIFLLPCLLFIITIVSGRSRANETVDIERPTNAQNQQKPEQFEFNLQETSVFELGEEISRYVVRGQSAQCQEQRFDEVKIYPTFKSSNPLYGSVRFYGRRIKNKLREFYFAVDESEGTGKGYDTLYFDKNSDLDLTNDASLKANLNPPKEALLPYTSIKQQVCFDKLNIKFIFGPDIEQTIEVMPRLILFDSNSRQFTFFSTKVRKGEVDVNSAKFDVFLGYTHSVGLPFDQAGAGFYLVPKGEKKEPPGWWGGDTLQAMHAVGGKFYRFASTQLGDKLFVKPYDGALGAFEIGAGSRDVKDISIYGSLRSESAAVAVGGEMENGWPKSAQKCQVPVGDYLPSYLRITFGRLSIFISDNYHSDGKPSVRADKQVYGIKIREDKPYVFDLSNKPEVLFASPAKDHRVKLGEQLMVKAVLIDPSLNIMIRGLEDTTRKQQRERSLDPKVVIRRASGEIAAEGVMPFG